MRSSQLDAARLDDELGAMLREQFMRCFALARPAAVARLQPELALLLDFLVGGWRATLEWWWPGAAGVRGRRPEAALQPLGCAATVWRARRPDGRLSFPSAAPTPAHPHTTKQIFRFSVWEGCPLPGMALMNLRYRSEAAVQRAGSGAAAGGGRSGVEGPGLSGAQRSLYCLGAVVLRYAWARLGHHAAAQHWGDASGDAGWRPRAWALMRQAETAYRLASLANFLAFLRTGRYR